MGDVITSLKLELLCSQKDAELAQLRAQIIIERLRKVTGASDDAQFDMASFSFVEPKVPEATPESEVM